MQIPRTRLTLEYRIKTNSHRTFVIVCNLRNEAHWHNIWIYTKPNRHNIIWKPNTNLNTYLSNLSQKTINAALSRCRFVRESWITETAQPSTFLSSRISSYFRWKAQTVKVNMFLKIEFKYLPHSVVYFYFYSLA